MTLQELEKIHTGEFPLPDLNNPTYYRMSEIRENDILIGAGILKATTETILVLDPHLSDFKKSYIIKKLFDDLSKKLLKSGMDDTHVFVCKDQLKFTNLLKKHFGFVNATGEALYWNGKTAN